MRQVIYDPVTCRLVAAYDTPGITVRYPGCITRSYNSGSDDEWQRLVKEPKCYGVVCLQPFRVERFGDKQPPSEVSSNIRS